MIIMIQQQQPNAVLRIVKSVDRLLLHSQQQKQWFVMRQYSTTCWIVTNPRRITKNTFTYNNNNNSNSNSNDTKRLSNNCINYYTTSTTLNLYDKQHQQQQQGITIKTIQPQKQIPDYTKRWKSTTTPNSIHNTNTNNNNNNVGRKRRKHKHGATRKAYDSSIQLDGLYRPGMTVPLKIKLNHYSSSSSSIGDDEKKDNNNEIVMEHDIILYTKMITNLLKDYHLKIIYRREDVWTMLRTHPDFIQLLSNLEQLLVLSNSSNNTSDSNNNNEIQTINTTSNNDSNNNNQENKLIFYKVWENINIESLLKLRVDIDNWIDSYEGKKLDTYLIYNDLNDNLNDQKKYQQNEIELNLMKRYKKIIIQVLLYYIPNYITVRRILPKDVTIDLIKVSTVHDELPIHYNIHFNPFTGTTNRVYGVYLNNITPIKDKVIPSRKLEPTSEQQQTLNEPIVILCVSLQPKVPRSLREIFCPETPVPTKTNSTTIIQQQDELIPKTNNHVATFYSIKNVQHDQYSKLKIGEYLIHEAVRMLQDESKITNEDTDDNNNNNNEIDIIRVKNETTKSSKIITSIDTFVTLSPIPGFGMWLRNEVDICTMYCSSDFIYDEQQGNGIIRKKSSLYHTMKFLSRQWDCTEEDVVTKITDLLYVRSNKERNKEKSKSQRKKKDNDDNNDKSTEHMLSSAAPNSSPQINAAIRYFLEGMAAHYIVNVKINDTNGTTTMTNTTEIYKPSNGVARFHLQNGAEVYRVNAFADLSISGIHESLSVMVNYRYDLSQLQYNQKQYETNYSVAVHEYVKQQLQ